MNETHFMTTLHYGLPASFGAPAGRRPLRSPAPAAPARRRNAVRPRWRRGFAPVVPTV